MAGGVNDFDIQSRNGFLSCGMSTLLTSTEFKVFLRLCSLCGAEAFANGEKLAANPWYAGTQEYRAWIEGWLRSRVQTHDGVINRPQEPNGRAIIS
jgi:hypothetical protein